MHTLIEIEDLKAAELMKLLCFSAKNGTLIYGNEKLLGYLKKGDGEDKIIFLSEDIQLKHQEMWRKKAEFHQAKVYKLRGHSMDIIGRRLGKRKLSVFATGDQNILNGIIDKVKD